MDVKIIVAELEESWRDTKLRWNDEYSSKFENAVIKELDFLLKDMGIVASKLNDIMEESFSQINRISDDCDE